jgi:hypothetical protein
MAERYGAQLDTADAIAALLVKDPSRSNASIAREVTHTSHNLVGRVRGELVDAGRIPDLPPHPPGRPKKVRP